MKASAPKFFAGIFLGSLVAFSSVLPALAQDKATPAVPAAGEGGAAAEEQTEFDVVLTGFGDKKLDVVKVVKAITGASLMEAKKMVEACPATLKEGVSKEDADKVKADVEAAGGSVELK